MGEKKAIPALIVGGEANAGPPLGPALGPLGVNVMSIVKAINEKTGEYSGMRVPVRISVDLETKEFEVEVGIPTASALIAKEAKIEKGSGSPKANFAGNLTADQVVKIAKLKQKQSYGATTTSVVKEILGSCVSMGITVEGEDPRQALEKFDVDRWDKLAGVGGQR